MSITIDLAAFKVSVAAKKEKFRKATRPAAQAGIQVIYEHARINAPVSGKAHFFYGTSYKKTGQKYGPFPPGHLRDSIYQSFSQDNSSEFKATYHVAWNHQKAPYGFMVHNGTSRAPANPFLVKAIHEQQPRALAEMRRTFIDLVQA